MILCLSLMLCTSCYHRVIGRILSSSFTLSGRATSSSSDNTSSP
jgi:hypothetical protein